jgi:hypothetical protein
MTVKKTSRLEKERWAFPFNTGPKNKHGLPVKSPKKRTFHEIAPTLRK